MAASLIWRLQARENPLLIYEFIGLENRTAAERLFISIEDKVTLPVDHPRRGFAGLISDRARGSYSKGRTYSLPDPSRYR
jgi:plasmid stabilization system protein ParE